MVSGQELLQILTDGLPSQRAAAAELLRKGTIQLTRDEILSVITREPIGTIRRSLEDALNEIALSVQKDISQTPDVYIDATAGSAQNLLRDLAGMISHETEPAIGWVRRAAARELGPEFEKSDTNRLIETLRERISGLIQLANISKPLAISRIDLSVATRTIVSELVDEAGVVKISCTGNGGNVATDHRLFALILSNSVRNAIEASRMSLVDRPTVLIEVNTNQSEFWITVRNLFHGSTFQLDEVANTGMSSKPDHKGYGVSAMRYAAERLGYVISLSGRGGVALFTLRGKRQRD